MYLKQKFLILSISHFSLLSFSCKFGQLGPGKCQFNSPHGFCLGMEQDIIVADTNNHRIQVFEKSGEFKTQFGIPGKLQLYQMSHFMFLTPLKMLSLCWDQLWNICLSLNEAEIKKMLTVVWSVVTDGTSVAA